MRVEAVLIVILLVVITALGGWLSLIGTLIGMALCWFVLRPIFDARHRKLLS